MSTDQRIDGRLAHAPVAIVGVACVLPDAPDVYAYWRTIVDAAVRRDDVGPVPGDPGARASLAARALLQDAGAAASPWYDPSSTGVVLGVTGPSPGPAAAGNRRRDLAGDRTGGPADDLAAQLGLGALHRTVDTTRTVSLGVVRDAVTELVDGRATMMIYGTCATAAGDSPDGPSLDDGVALLALRRLSDAERDGNRIYAVIRGIEDAGDDQPTASPTAPTTVELVEAVEGADADAASLIRLALSLHHRIWPPAASPQPSGDSTSAIDPTRTGARPWIRDPRRPVRRARASAARPGGRPVRVRLEEHGADRRHVRTMHRAARAYLWHAPDADGLLEMLRAGTPPDDATRIPPDAARIGFVAADPAGAERLRALAARHLADTRGADQWSHPARIFFRRRAGPEPAVGALFAGQGSQYPTMGLSAALTIAPVGSALDDAEAWFTGDGPRLAQVVYPPAAADDAARKQQEEALRRTEYAQPAIGALSAGHFRYLIELGLRCSGFLGHSFGELTALWAAGALDDADFFRLARARGAAMAPPADAAAHDPGTMAAVEATPEELSGVLRAFPDVMICNHNAPDQVVLGGPTEAVGEAVRECERRGMTARLLPVAAAFHTSHVAHAVEAFRPAVEATVIRAPARPVYANTPGAWYGDDLEHNRQVLTAQLRQPVEFVEALRAMHADGCTVFVEFGPKQILAGLVRRTLPASPVVAISCDPGPLGDSDAALKLAAVQLAVLGAPVVGLNRYEASPPRIALAEPAA
ncbi:MAG: acyltransferase domain-containing protein [Frankia sp.]